MIDPNPCKDCPDRHYACQDHCEKREKWLEQYHGQQKHLKDNRNRFAVPLTDSRVKAYEKYYHHRKSSKGGKYGQ